MNKNGFTLIELLAVIIILSLLVLLTSTAVTKIVKDSKQELSSTQIATIESTAKLWGADNLDKLPDAGECGYVTLEDLKEFGYIDSNIIDPNSNSNISDELLIKLTTTLSSYGVPITNYEVNPESVEGCKHSPIICELDEGYTSKNVGAKYTCNLDIEREFYVLENNSESKKISLIMDKNYSDSYVPITTSWCTDGESDNTTCKNINATGSAAPEGKDYIGHITEVFDTLGITVSFPTASQIALADGKNYLNYPLLSQSWLYGNLNSSSVPYGYWTASPNDDYINIAWYVSYGGYLSGDFAHNDFDIDVNIDTRYGVRPVITISKSLLD